MTIITQRASVLGQGIVLFIGRLIFALILDRDRDVFAVNGELIGFICADFSGIPLKIERNVGFDFTVFRRFLLVDVIFIISKDNIPVSVGILHELVGATDGSVGTEIRGVLQTAFFSAAIIQLVETLWNRDIYFIIIGLDAVSRDIMQIDKAMKLIGYGTLCDVRVVGVLQLLNLEIGYILRTIQHL